MQQYGNNWSNKIQKLILGNYEFYESHFLSFRQLTELIFPSTTTVLHSLSHFKAERHQRCDNMEMISLIQFQKPEL